MISIDDELCIACGLCESSLPQYFKLEGGVVRVLESKAGEGDARALAEVAEDCPAGAIALEATEGCA